MEHNNPSANLTTEQRQLLTETRDYLYKVYTKNMFTYALFGMDGDDFREMRDKLGRLNYQLGIHVPAGTTRYEFVVTYPDRTVTGTITDCESGIDMTADEFLLRLRGLSDTNPFYIETAHGDHV